jgi:hypothetical protein
LLKSAVNAGVFCCRFARDVIFVRSRSDKLFACKTAISNISGAASEHAQYGWAVGQSVVLANEGLLRVDNITLYWLTGTGASAARSYWGDGQAIPQAADQAPPPVTVPVGFTTFPGEIWRTPRSWVEKSYPTVSYFNEVDKGGHFAAWEEPDVFTDEVRAAFRSLR